MSFDPILLYFGRPLIVFDMELPFILERRGGIDAYSNLKSYAQVFQLIKKQRI
ncbi:MAG: hypothetical protein WDW20_05475 [Neisseriaceae bacterium]